jgi:hypothetical protein
MNRREILKGAVKGLILAATGNVVFAAEHANQLFATRDNINSANAARSAPPSDTGTVPTRKHKILNGSVIINDFPDANTAVTSLGSNGGTIVFPYKASGYALGTLNVNQSNIRLEFNGSPITGTIRIVPQSLVTSGRAAGTDYPSSWKNGSTPLPFDGDYDTMMHESTDASRIKNIQITGLKSTDTNVTIRGFSIDGITIEYCDIQPTSQSAIRLFHCTRINIKNNTLGGSGTYVLFMCKCASWTVENNIWTSATATRHCSAKGAMHQPGKTIFQANDSGYLYPVGASFQRNKVLAGIDGVFWDTVPNPLPDVVGYAGRTPIGFTRGAWMGAGKGYTIANNPLINLANASPASSEGRAIWASYPHEDCDIFNNYILDGGIFGASVKGFIVRNNNQKFTRAHQFAILVQSDTPSSTTNEEFSITGNTITNFDATGGGFFAAIGVQGLHGEVKNNTGHGIGTTATCFIGLNATTDEVHIEGNKLFKNGGTQSVLNSGSQNAHGKKFNNDTIDIST